MKLVLMIFFVLQLSTAYTQEKIMGTVSKVIDGNTIEITTLQKEAYHVLLHGIDSPEPGQPHAQRATQYLASLLLNKPVTISLHGRDRQGNRIGDIHIEGAPDPRHEMLKAGLAWTSEHQPDPALEALKEQARQQNIGLWQEENPTPPWTYRRQQTMLDAKGS